jgi:hypothetical protein
LSGERSAKTAHSQSNVSCSATRSAQKAPVRRQIHDHLRDAERQHLRIGEAPLGVLAGIGKEIVRRAEHTYQQQLEVGVHYSALRVDDWVSSADFELFLEVPSPRPATHIAESII